MKWMWMLMLCLLATPAMAKEVETVPRLGLGTDSLVGGVWTYGRLDIFEVYDLSKSERVAVSPVVGGVGLEIASNWDNLTSFGVSSVAGFRTAYLSFGGSVLWDQDKHQPLDAGATAGVHGPMFSAEYLYTVRGEAIVVVAVVLDAKFWIRLSRNQRQFKETTSRSTE
jgi:hypothetical protein